MGSSETNSGHFSSKIGTIICHKVESTGDRCQLVFITNRKSHTGFRLVTSVTFVWPWTVK